MQKQPFINGTFAVCSTSSPRWLTTNSQDEIIWTLWYPQAKKFDIISFNEMISKNKWLQDVDFWFQRLSP